jgi:hypothetical protein
MSMDGASSAPATGDREELEAERDRLRRRVDELEARPRHRRRTRRIFAAILLILSVVAFAAAVPGLWARRTLLDTDRYVSLVAPMAREPAVQDYLARTVTSAVFDALAVEERLSEALDERFPRLTFLAGPITTGVRGFIQGRVEGVVSNEAFAAFWEGANRFVHERLVAALQGEEEGSLVTDGKVALNLLPIVNEVLRQISNVASELIGRDLSLPPVTTEEVQAEVVPRLEAALGVDLPDDFGTIVIYDGEELAVAQRAVSVFERAVVLFVLAFVVFTIAALWLSPAKRRTLAQLLTALFVVLVVQRRVAIVAADRVIDQVREENREAARAVVDPVLGSLLSFTAWLLLIASVALIIVLVTGPYPWAVRLRTWVRGLGTAAAGVFREGRPTPGAAWVSAHRDALLLGGAAVGGLIVLLADLSFGWLLVVILLIGAFELLVYRVAATTGRTASPATSTPAP